jgi:hypothetical protein
MKTIPRSIILTAVLALLVSSCATQYHGGLQPVSPKPPGAGVGNYPTVDSLQPTLSWKNESASETKYDIVIYTGVGKSSSYGLSSGLLGVLKVPVYYVRGVEVYYREGIEGCSHHVEQALEPKTIYVWAVRTRSGSNVGPWTTYDFEKGVGALSGTHEHIHGDDAWGQNLWWSFQTPRR